MANEKRLIDANALLARLANSSESWAKNIQAIRNWWPHAVGIKDNIVSLVKEAPTVDAVELPCEVGHTVFFVVTECDENGEESFGISIGKIHSFSIQSEPVTEAAQSNRPTQTASGQ